MNTNRTTDEIQVPAEPPRPEEPAMRFVDVHIYDYEPEEVAGIESQRGPEPAPPDEHDQHDAGPARPLRKYGYLLMVCVVLLSLVGASAWVLVSMWPLFPPDATITIVPNTQPIRTTQTILVTTGQARGTHLQGRALSTITMNQARTVPTTGTGHQDAKAAHGYLTFYNAAPYPQTVTAGTLLTGADGIQVVTDANAVLPAGTLATNGQASVSAHTVETGPQGNIHAGDIYGSCCRVNVFAANATFIGGQQARDYPTVTQQDITTVVSNLKTSLNQSVQAALQTQVHDDETLLAPFPCQQRVQPDHRVGEEAAQVTITVSETCTAMTYQTQALHALVTRILTQQALAHLGDGYTMQGMVQASVNQVTQGGKGQEIVHVTCAATWGYQFSHQQQVQIKAQIAGKRKDTAIHTLLHTPGVQSVSIESESLPTDVSHIHLVFVVMP